MKPALTPRLLKQLATLKIGIMWTQVEDASPNPFSPAPQLDNDGHIIVAGEGNEDIDGETNIGGYDVLLVSFTSSGTRRWTRLAGSTSSDEARAMQAGNMGCCRA